MDDVNGTQSKQTTFFKQCEDIPAFIIVCNADGPISYEKL